MLIEKDAAKDLLRQVLEELWEQTRRPVPGSQLKAQLLEQVHRAGLEFDEGSLGYAGFGKFVADCDFACTRYRPGTDILVVPFSEAASLDLEAPAKLRMRTDFWTAFVQFPRIGVTRAYDAVNRRVVRSPPDDIPEAPIFITPISKEMQLAWRTEFIREFGAGSSLEGLELQPESGFKDFSRELQALPALRRQWHELWFGKVRDTVQEWAIVNRVPEDIWLVKAEADSRSQADTRRNLYKLLDQVPLDHLLDITIPLRWLLSKRDPNDKQ